MAAHKKFNQSTRPSRVALAHCKASVIVPVYRDWLKVRDLLVSLQAQTWRDFEVILVNNNSNARGYPDDLPDPGAYVRVIDCDMPGSYAARNMGALHAVGQLLAFTDADCLPSSGWLQALVCAEDEMGDKILAGSIEVFTAKTPNNWEIFDAVRGMRQDVFVRHGYGVTANLAIRASLFRQLGGFDDTRLSGGDAEFCRRAGRAGVGLRLMSAAKVRHPARNTKEQLETKARRIKGGQVGTGPLKRRIIWTFRSLIPPIREMYAYLCEKHYPIRWKLIACRVRLHLWSVELRELYRLIFCREAPERR